MKDWSWIACKSQLSGVLMADGFKLQTDIYAILVQLVTEEKTCFCPFKNEKSKYIFKYQIVDM